METQWRWPSIHLDGGNRISNFGKHRDTDHPKQAGQCFDQPEITIKDVATDAGSRFRLIRKLLDRTVWIQPHVKIIVYRSHEHVHFVFKEVVGAWNFIVMYRNMPLRPQFID